MSAATRILLESRSAPALISRGALCEHFGLPDWMIGRAIDLAVASGQLPPAWGRPRGGGVSADQLPIVRAALTELGHLQEVQ